MKQIDTNLLITIEDNGVGFNAENTALKKGVGLDLIKTQIKNLNGHIQITSIENKGTSIEISVPVIIA